MDHIEDGETVMEELKERLAATDAKVDAALAMLRKLLAAAEPIQRRPVGFPR